MAERERDSKGGRDCREERSRGRGKNGWDRKQGGKRVIGLMGGMCKREGER